MNGLLLIDKPSGWTSHDVVAKIRSLLKKETSQKIKVGHAGTLDPFATGLLIILIGSYTKRAAEFLKLDKTYELTMKLGEVSTTGDPEGVITGVSSQEVGAREVKKALQSFVGEIEQTPPAYSAIKVNGKRAYKLAREGKKVELPSRKVHVYELDGIDYRYPRLSFTVKVSSGTYIRSLAEDIGKALGTGAYCTELRRLEAGRYGLTRAVRPDQLDAADIAGRLVSA
jgi:tRNA pseudouridine55 synthase